MSIPDLSAAVSAAVTAAGGLLVWYIKEARTARIQARQQADLISSALVVLIRNQLVMTHRSAIGRSEITIAERQSFREMHKLYVGLGGNGPTSHLAEDIDRLRVIVD